MRIKHTFLIVAVLIAFWACRQNSVVLREDDKSVVYLKQKGIEVCDTYSEECGSCGCCGKPTDCLCPVVIPVDGKYREVRNKSASGDYDYIRSLFVNGQYKKIAGFNTLWDGVVDSIVDGYYSFYFKGSCAINNKTTDMWLVVDRQTGKVKWAIRWVLEEQ